MNAAEEEAATEKRTNERERMFRQTGWGLKNYAVRGDISESVLRQTSPEPFTTDSSRRGGKRESLRVCLNPNPSSFCRNANKSVCGTKKKIASRRESSETHISSMPAHFSRLINFHAAAR
jgi:hypothetical protein